MAQAVKELAGMENASIEVINLLTLLSQQIKQN